MLPPDAAIVCRGWPVIRRGAVDGRQPPGSVTTTVNVIVVSVVPDFGVALGALAARWWAAPLQPAAATTGIASDRGSQAGTASQLATTISVASATPRTTTARARTSPRAPFWCGTPVIRP
jgi:hypothetical protein